MIRMLFALSHFQRSFNRVVANVVLLDIFARWFCEIVFIELE